LKSFIKSFEFSFYMGEEKTYPLPENSLLQWEQVPRPIGSAQFPNDQFGLSHPLRGTIWDEVGLECRLYNSESSWGSDTILTPMNHEFYDDMEVSGFSEFLRCDYSQISTRRDPFHMDQVGERVINELLYYPFNDIGSITQFQDGVEEVITNPELGSAAFVGLLENVLGAITDADRSDDSYLQKVDAAILGSVDVLVEHFPQVESKFWKDIYQIFISGHAKNSPAHDYKNLLVADTLGLNVTAGQPPTWEVVPGGEEASDNSVMSFAPNRLLKESYQRQKAMTLIRDCVRLSAASIFMAQAVKKYGLTRASFGDTFDIKGLGHPVFYGNESAEFHPNDVKYGSEEQILIITGPTASGKTTAAQSIGALSLTGQACGFVCANSAQIPLFDQMMSSFGYQGSLGEGKSSHVAEIQRFSAQYDAINGRALFIGDDIYKTSEVSVGPVLLPSTLRALGNTGVVGVFDSHYHEAVRPMEGELAFKFMFIDIDRFFDLNPGVSPGGYAVQSALRAGIHPDLIDTNGEVLREPETPTRVFEYNASGLDKNIELTRRPLAQILSDFEFAQTQATRQTRLSEVKRESGDVDDDDLEPYDDDDF